MQGEIVDLQFAMKDSSNFIKAKAMLTVLLSNKFLRDDILFKHKEAIQNPKNTTKRDTRETGHEIKENRLETRQRPSKNYQRDKFQTSQYETTDLCLLFHIVKFEITDHEKRYRKAREVKSRCFYPSDNCYRSKQPYTDYTTDYSSVDEYDEIEDQYADRHQKPQYKPHPKTYQRRIDNTYRDKRQYRRNNKSDRGDHHYRRPIRSDRRKYNNQNTRDYKQYQNKWYDRNFPPLQARNNNPTTKGKN